MNKTWAKAWDDVVAFAEAQAGHDRVLDRDGHRFFASWHTNIDEVQVWGEDAPPAYGMRMGPVSARFWNIGSLIYTYHALVDARKNNPSDVDLGPSTAKK